MLSSLALTCRTSMALAPASGTCCRPAAVRAACPEPAACSGAPKIFTETMNKGRCIEESALPAAASVAEYAAKVRAMMNRPHKPARMRVDATKRHEHDTRSPEEEAERDRQWIGFAQGDACVRKRRARCNVDLRNLHKRSRVGA